MHHNLFGRALVYERPNGVPTEADWSPPGLDGCYDCTRLLGLLARLCEQRSAKGVPALYSRMLAPLSTKKRNLVA